MRALHALLLALLVLVQGVPPASATAGPDQYAAVDAYVQQQIDRYHIPALAVGIVQDGQIVHLRGFGTARPGGPAVTPQTPFVLASVSKSFTGLAIMQLVEAGRVDLDATVQTYLPWFRLADPAASARITVGDLLYMASGISTRTGNEALVRGDADATTLAKYVRALNTVQLVHPVGATYEYSNTNYRILGLIVETVSGEPYADYVKRHILDPLRMPNSYAIDPRPDQPSYAAGTRTVDGTAQALGWHMPAYQVPSGGMVTSAEDHCHYLLAMLGGGSYGGASVLSPEGVAALQTPGSRINANAGYAMGWVVNTANNPPTISHNGGIQGHRTFQQLIPEAGLGFVLLTSLDLEQPHPDINKMGADIRRLLLGQA